MSSSGKPMSISSIIATPPPLFSSSHKLYHKEVLERRASAPIHPYNYSLRNQNPLFRSPPTTPETKLWELSRPTSPSSSISSSSPKRSSYLHQHQDYFLQKYQSEIHHAHLIMNRDDEDEVMESQEGEHPPLTLQERRLRNKAASAKYRQKKNQQQNEMRLMINRLSEQNAVLERQLQEVRLENERLKATTDRLRGKIVAKKMFKKWIGRRSVVDNNTSYTSPNNDNDNDNQQQLSYPTIVSNTTHAKHHHCTYLNLSSTNCIKNHNSHEYSSSSMSSDSDNDGHISAIIATLSSDQDENDELESLS
ncbi:uncharacterized protein BX663DRAFT_488325 [Cokeromyces recurvatus]|uniref:uncharacterized protein n=1 Tax=Cokeromyces recurvatus TaxID=90255 RepID=UPI00222123EB|nr:uncharacterized protein BX663DRAFT_488325 [Cokeromyces recurvatus]KAI7900382.1 hypothetical protein BX663DRAFT_488325 [Cokeromyces recurvatus]